MNKRNLVVVLVLSLAMNASVLGTMAYEYYQKKHLAQSVPCPISPAHQHLYQDLGLSVSQLAQMEPMAQKFHGRIADLGAAMKGKNNRLIEFLGQKDIDPGQVEELRKEMAGVQQGIQKEVIAHILETKKILDSKQQERFFALLRQSMAGENQL
jgi:Spy/CpxP family protein refolding chaperone